MITTLNDFNNPFFIGIAGTGMSALAQYLNGCGKTVSGSDRYFHPGEPNDTREKLEAEGIQCFLQDGSGITTKTDIIICSTAVEDTVVEMVKAREMNIPILRRSELLALISQSKKTIAVGGTSGKSTTSAMLYDILQQAGLEPGIISGAGLVSLIEQGKIGNAMVGKGNWLVIEADESDGSIVQYHPKTGIVLNIDKDHKEIDALMEIFATFKGHSKKFMVNQSHPLAKTLSQNAAQDFSIDGHKAGFMATGFEQKEFNIHFTVNGTPFSIPLVGKHNMENAVAAIAAAAQIGVSLETCSKALEQYRGIYRRHQVLGKKNGIWLIDDYAHNPVKCAASIAACQPVAEKVVAWFQPHGYGPTKFLRKDFVHEIAAALRPQDEIWMSEIFYAGGTAIKDISASELVDDIKALGKNAFFIEHREDFLKAARSHLTEGSVLLLMGARDPGLEHFARWVWQHL